MGVYKYWCCPERMEYLDSSHLRDDRKMPIGETALLLFELCYSGNWRGLDIRLVNDAGDTPWDTDPSAGWIDVTLATAAYFADELAEFRGETL